MTYLTLAKIKKHLNIDTDFTDDDEYLNDLGDVAEQIVAKHLDTDLENLEYEEGDLPMPVLHAMYLLIGNFYKSRESISYASVSEVPLSYEYLLSNYKEYGHSNI